MPHLNLSSFIPVKLKGFKFPHVDRDKIKKFFYENYLDVHEDDSIETLRNKVKSRK